MESSSQPVIRMACARDANSLLEIYRPYVETTAISFDTVTPGVEAFASRIASAQEKRGWLVAESDGRCIGYAYGTAHRPQEAYRYSVEVSAYVPDEYSRRGVAGRFYTGLFTILGQNGYQSAYAGVARPNDRSCRSHEELGFRYIGVFPMVGYKFGKWHDVAWYYRPLAKSA